MRFLLLLFSIFLFCNVQSQSTYFPDRNAEWERLSLDGFRNIDTAALNAAVRYAKENEYSGERDLRIAILKGFAREPFHYLAGPVKERGGPAGMILKNGYVVAQWGDTKRVDMTFSVTKSYLSTVAGLAWDNGLIGDLQQPVGQTVWDGTFAGEHNAKITWDHLLTQSSDLSGELWGMKDWADRPPRDGGIDDWKYRELKEPGTHFEYNDVRVNVLAYSLLQVWRKPLPMVLKEGVMDRIGASPSWRWFGYEHSYTNVDGIQMQSVSGGGHSGGGLFINTEDHARFGLLFLNNGRWKDQQIISSEWVKQVQQPSSANANYGYMWWNNRAGSNRHWEGVSEELYYAAGFGGNFIIIDEAEQMVIVTRWLAPSQVGTFVKMVREAMVSD